MKKVLAVGVFYLIGRNLPYLWIRLTEYWHPFTGAQPKESRGRSF